MKPLIKATVWNSQMKLDEVISRLVEIRSNMKPCENWTHAESVCRDVNKLVEVANDMIYLVEKNKK